MLATGCLQQAKSQTTIAGQLYDVNQRPVSFASVILLLGNRFCVGTIADQQGRFILNHAFSDSSSYTIKISLAGYETFVREFIFPDTGFMKAIVLKNEQGRLSTVTVSSQKPFVVQMADRFVVNIENSYLAVGNSGLDVLQKAPGIWVNSNGGIRIKANMPVTVIVNNQVQRMSEEDLAEYLKTLKSEEISRIEVITNPPAEYEAAGSGGVIHIILKKNKRTGLNGSANAQYRQQGSRSYYSPGISAEYKIKKIYLSAATSFNSDLKSFYERSSILYPDKSIYSNYTDRYENAFRTQWRGAFSYDINPNQTIGIMTSNAMNKMDQLFLTSLSYHAGLANTTGNGQAKRMRSLFLNGTSFNYTIQLDSVSSLKVLADYNYNVKRENSSYTSVYSDPLQNAEYRSGTPNQTIIYTAAVDYKGQMKNKSVITAGVKYASIERENTIAKEDYKNNTWLFDTAGSNIFNYKENLLMGYISAEKTTGKMNMKLGVRAEETFAAGDNISSGQQFRKKYPGLFPSFYITRKMDDQGSKVLYFNYSRKLLRPTLFQLNPLRIEFNNYTALTGNTALLPQYSHNLESGYRFLNDYAAGFYFTLTRNVISLLASAGNNNFIEYKSANLGSSRESGFLLTAPFKISKRWSVDNNFSCSRLVYNLDSSRVENNSFAVKSIHTITINNKADLDAEAEYRSASVADNYRLPSSFYLDIGFTWKLIKNKARLRLNCTDIFNTLREKELTNFNSTIIDFFRKRPTRTFALSFTCNFSAGRKFSSRKIDSGNNEERSRIAN